MNTAQFVVSLVTLVVVLIVLWSGIRRLEFGSLAATVMSVTELLAVALAIVGLGWWGLGIFIGSNIVAVLVWSVVLAARRQTKLVHASILAREPKDKMYALAERLRRRDEMRSYSPIAVADLLVLLADRNRSIAEIEAMAVPIAMLKTIHDVSLDWLVDRFDQIMRLSGESDPMQVADIVHNTTVNSPMTFREALDALVTVYGGDITTIGATHSNPSRL